MPFTLDQIVPWGRSFKEYVRMFSLTDIDLGKRIVGCGDGPASFNAAMRRQGNKVVSVDPLYQFSGEQIRRRVQEAYRTIMEQLEANQSAYTWTTIRSPQDLGRIRLKAMEDPGGTSSKARMKAGICLMNCPSCPLRTGEFDLVLCSHLLFTYSKQLSLDFHCRAVLEMCQLPRKYESSPC